MYKKNRSCQYFGAIQWLGFRCVAETCDVRAFGPSTVRQQDMHAMSSTRLNLGGASATAGCKEHRVGVQERTRPETAQGSSGLHLFRCCFNAESAEKIFQRFLANDHALQVVLVALKGPSFGGRLHDGNSMLVCREPQIGML